MRYLSLFDGIGAASVAWEPLGWECVGVSEIDRFPIAVTSHHRPSVPHLGDVTKITESQVSAIGHIDLIVGGFPCQDLSVAGKRAGLRNEDGSTTRSGLFFDAMRIVQWARKHCGLRYLLIENVPGLYSSNKGRDFAAVVGEMVGTEFDVPGDGWRNAGFAVGPEGMCEWATLDAQFFNVAQRRVRVFVVADFGDWTNRPPILLEPDSLRGDSPPRREAGEVAPTIPSRRSCGGGLGTDFDCDGGLIHAPGRDVDSVESLQVISMAHGQGGAEIGFDRGPTLTCNHEAPIVAHTLRDEGFDASEDGTGRGTPLVPVGVTIHGTDKTAKVASYTDVAGCLRADVPGRIENSSTTVVQHPVPLAVRTANTSANGHGIAENVAHTLDQAQGKCVAFMADDYKDGGYEECDTARPLTTSADRTRAAPVVVTTGESCASTSEGDTCSPLRALREAIGTQAFAEWGLGILDSLRPSQVLRQAVHGVGLRLPAFTRSWVVYCALSRPQDGPCWLLQSLREIEREGCPPQGWEPSEQLTGKLGAYLSQLSQPGAQAERFVRDLWRSDEGDGVLRQALSAIQEARRSAGGEGQPAHTGMAVRRLTATECEFLQGFPRNYTAIPWRGKPAAQCPDGPRYKALGNSFAVPVVRWIGSQIERASAWRA